MSQQSINPDKVYLFVNNQMIASYLKPRELVIYLLLNVLDTMYSPLDVLFENILGIFSFGREYALQTKQPSKGLSFNLKQIAYWKKIEDRETFLRQFYNLVLSLEGQGNLPGFGFTNRFGDKLRGNPEKDSYR